MGKAKILSVLLMAVSVLLAQETGFEPPYQGLKLLGDSTALECPVCVTDMQKRAFRIIDQALPSGKEIETSPGFTLVRNGSCKDGELLMSSYLERKTVGEDPQKGRILAPLFVFYFHTKRHHLVGIKSEDMTGENADTQYGGAADGITRMFTGRLVLIPYGYGDGATFIYFQKENKIQVQCRILDLKRIE